MYWWVSERESLLGDFRHCCYSVQRDGKVFSPPSDICTTYHHGKKKEREREEDTGTFALEEPVDLLYRSFSFSDIPSLAEET